jgi:hypothetical protein
LGAVAGNTNALRLKRVMGEPRKSVTRPYPGCAPIFPVRQRQRRAALGGGPSERPARRVHSMRGLDEGEAIGRGMEMHDVEGGTGKDGEDVLAGREGMQG